MKDITVTIDGRQVRIPKEEFWGIYNKLHEEAEKENIRGAIDSLADGCEMDEETYEKVVDYIYEDIEEGVERCWDFEVCESYHQAIAYLEIEEVGA